MMEIKKWRDEEKTIQRRKKATVGFPNSIRGEGGERGKGKHGQDSGRGDQKQRRLQYICPGHRPVKKKGGRKVSLKISQVKVSSARPRPVWRGGGGKERKTRSLSTVGGGGGGGGGGRGGIKERERGKEVFSAIGGGGRRGKKHFRFLTPS